MYKYGKKRSVRDATSLGSAKQLLRALHVVEFIEEMIDAGKSSTLREMYYISEAWGLGKFSSQNESNNLAEDLEVVTKCLREDFKLRPEEDGARMIGNLTLRERNRRGEWMRINARDDVGDSGYGVPYNVEEEKIELLEHDINFIMAIETGGMFDRLIENGFDEDFGCGLVHLKGQPARSTRRILKRMSEEWDLPVVVFLDGDPWSFRIFASIAYGAIKTAHISEYLATPSATYLGITASFQPKPETALETRLRTPTPVGRPTSSLPAQEPTRWPFSWKPWSTFRPTIPVRSTCPSSTPTPR